MAELKTQPARKSVTSFLRGIKDDAKRKDPRAILKMMKDATGEKPKCVARASSASETITTSTKGGEKEIVS